jgi:chaperone required for assembly of F1-ATPase
MIKGEAIRLPRRFYAETGVASAPGGFAVTLDGRPVKTPAKAGLVVPTAALAEALAAEWAAQDVYIDPHTMPLTRLANVAVDRAATTRADMAAMIAKYGETDLLCHRAEAPERLRALQAKHWDPPLAWAEQALAIRLDSVAGIIAAPPSADACARIEAVALGFGDFALTGLAHAVGVTGSAVLGLCIAHRVPPVADDLHQAASLDELWSLETWGEDDDLRTRVERVRLELAALEVWFERLLKPGQDRLA